MKSDGNTKLESSAKTPGSRKTVHRNDQDSSKDQRWLKGFRKEEKKQRSRLEVTYFCVPW